MPCSTPPNDRQGGFAAKVLSQDDEQAIRELLMGRRIVSAERGEWKVGRWGENAEGRLTLDDGSTVLVAANEGCGGCGNGWYHVEHLATIENAITDVRLAVEGETDKYGEGEQSYRIYVIAGGDEINAVQVDGDDGNGYYGTGYELFVMPPGAESHA